MGTNEASEAGSEDLGLVYVLSTGRSGSTLLEMLLFRYLDLTTVGEVQLLGYELNDSRYRCSCGQRTVECPFWTEVAAGLPPDLNQAGLNLFREAHNRGRTLRPWTLLRMVLRMRQTAEHKSYADLNIGLFAAIACTANTQTGRRVRWIADASKDPYRCHTLAAAGDLNMCVIHLVRSPMGFVHSVMKGEGRPARGIARGLEVVRLALRWRVSNAVYLLAARRNGAQAARLWCEDLAAKLDLPLREGAEDDVVHAIAGSRLRGESKSVRLDDSWKTALGTTDRLIVSLLCGGLERRLKRDAAA